MKISTLLIFISAFSLSAESGYSQDKDISLKLSNVYTIENVISEIEKTTDYVFIYNEDVVPTLKKEAKVDMSDQSLDEILNQLIRGTDLAYSLSSKQVTLYKDASKKVYAQIVSSAPLVVQQPSGKTIAGRVTDTYGESLPGVTVVVKGTTKGTVTDVDGNFSLTDVPENATLQFSFVGMKMQELPIGNQTRFGVVMEEEAIGLEELIAIGYGTQKKVNMTGSVDVISADRLQNRQATTVSQLLQGESPGMTLDVGQYGFEPGASMSIDIRGIGSLNGGSPYILIDGVPGDINKLNPEDIESISVLKDAASSAIYGSRAPYGVILVITKRGKKNEPMKVSYTGSVYTKSPPPLPEPTTGLEWMKVTNETGRNKGVVYFNNARVDRAYAYEREDWEYIRNSFPEGTFGPWPEGATYYGVSPGVKGEWGWGYGSWNWWEEHYTTSVNHKHQFSVTGGSQKASYYFSAGYLDDDNVYRHAKDNYQRTNFNGKVDLALADWWDFSWNSRMSRSVRSKPSDYSSLLSKIATIYPATVPWDGFGNYDVFAGIPTLKKGGDDIRRDTEFMNVFETQVRPLEGWDINVSFAYESNDYVQTREKNLIDKYDTDNVKFIYPGSIPNMTERQQYNSEYWTLNLYTSYAFSDNSENHNFGVTAGMQLEKGGPNYRLWGQKYNVIVDQVHSIKTATGDYLLDESISHSATQGYFGRLTYNYKQRYLLESNFRYDGSYIFRKGNRWGFFPSFSAGWNIDREEFWDVSQNFISALKIRASWGELGNMQISPYSDLELIPISTSKLNWIYGYGNTRSVGYTTAPSIVYRNLTWETATTANLGLDMAFINNKLRTSLDLFQRTTTDMVGPSEAKPGVLGASVPKVNNSTLRTRGWDLVVSWRDNISEDLSYFIRFNLSDNKTVVTQYNNPTKTLSTWYEGQEVGEIWGYTAHDLIRTQEELDNWLAETDPSFLAVDWNTGDIKFEDINNDGKVNNGKYTADDPGDLSIIGNSQPHYQFGLSAGLNYKGIDFSMTMGGNLKQDVFFGQYSTVYWGILHPFYSETAQKRSLDYFRDQPGTRYIGLYEGDANINLDAYWPRPYGDAANDYKNKGNVTTRYLESRAHLRLHNIQLGYTLPDNVVSKLHLQKLRVFFSGENLLTFTSLPPGIDPVATTGYGNQFGRVTNLANRICSLGLTIDF